MTFPPRQQLVCKNLAKMPLPSQNPAQMRDPADELNSLTEQKLRRGLREIEASSPTTVTVEGRQLVNFSSNDYLGFAHHPALREAAQEAAARFGCGSTASRLVCGSQRIQHELEEELAAAKKRPAALTFANGYATALGTLGALLRKGDTVILDKLSHASLIDGARLSGATLRVFPHNRLDKLEHLLRQSREKAGREARVIVVTESVFSMDGDIAPLAGIVELKERYGAWLLVDEAHGFGIFGKKGLGVIEELGLQERVELQMGTLGKALGSAGGYLAATREIIDLLINKARSLIYSTAPPPAQHAASLAALRLLLSAEGREIRARLHRNINRFHEQLATTGLPLPENRSQIIPLILGDNQAALSAARFLNAHGFLVPAIRYPTVPREAARLRLTLSASHQEAQLEALGALLLDISRNQADTPTPREDSL
ncbi:MAG: 8-amino-7-oxononanoate synthase [Verrucomicrobiales bacterium]